MAEQLTPLKAIRAYCLGCMCNQPNEVKLCPITKCELYPYRFGKNPYAKRELTEEQKVNLREHGRKYSSNLRNFHDGDKETHPTEEE